MLKACLYVHTAAAHDWTDSKQAWGVIQQSSTAAWAHVAVLLQTHILHACLLYSSAMELHTDAHL